MGIYMRGYDSHRDQWEAGRERREMDSSCRVVDGSLLDLSIWASFTPAVCPENFIDDGVGGNSRASTLLSRRMDVTVDYRGKRRIICTSMGRSDGKIPH